MVTKQITDFNDDAAPADDSEVLLQTSGLVTKKASVLNFLKRVFWHQPVWEDLMGEWIAREKGSNAPVFTNLRDGLWLFAFDDTKEREMWLIFHLHHNIKFDEDMYFHIHWTHNVGSPSGDVVWGLEYTMARGYDEDIFPASTILTTTVTAGVQYNHHITGDNADFLIPKSTWADQLEPDTIILARVFRDPLDVADTFNDDAFFITCDIHHQVAQNGTNERNRPFPSAGFGA